MYLKLNMKLPEIQEMQRYTMVVCLLLSTKGHCDLTSLPQLHQNHQHFPDLFQGLYPTLIDDKMKPKITHRYLYLVK